MLKTMSQKGRLLWRARKYAHGSNKAELQHMLELIQPGSTVFDIGAHKGGFLFWMQRAVGTSGKVYGFEPQPALSQYLLDMKDLFDWRNVTVEPMGLSSMSAEKPLLVPTASGETSPGATFVDKKKTEEDFISFSVQVTTLDEYCTQYDISNVSLIKMDTEGHELDVFQGAQEMLRRERPHLIFECEQRHLQSPRTMDDVFAFLADLGYEGYFYHESGLRPLSEFEPSVHQASDSDRFWDADDYCNNFYFKPAS